MEETGVGKEYFQKIPVFGSPLWILCHWEDRVTPVLHQFHNSDIGHDTEKESNIVMMSISRDRINTKLLITYV